MQRQRLLSSLASAWRQASAAVAPSGALAALQQQHTAAAATSSNGGLRQALQLVSCRWFQASPAARAAEREYIALNNIADNPGATHSVRWGGQPRVAAGRRRRRRLPTRARAAEHQFRCSICSPPSSPPLCLARLTQIKRVGRGIGSGLGKTSGRGHKGQKARTGRRCGRELSSPRSDPPLQLQLDGLGCSAQPLGSTQTLAAGLQRVLSARLPLPHTTPCAPPPLAQPPAGV